jgi:hypothetical protein
MTSKELHELNVWIAEHVMNAKQFVGLKKHGYWYRPNACGYTDRESEAWHLTREEAKQHEYLLGHEPVTICEFGIPFYSTDFSAAMQVLEKCYGELSICSCKTTTGFKFWLPNGFIGAVESETLPLAICLLAKQLFSK